MKRGHLRRLDRVWIEDPIYFVTTCAEGRSPIFAHAAAHAILRRHLERMAEVDGWSVGRYVVMPDHVHFFCAPAPNARPLSAAVGAFKSTSSRSIKRETGRDGPIWQREFFDHVLRSRESYDSKWRYVAENPVRAGLAAAPADWPYAGEVVPLEVA
ncbi:transposase [Bradyrhizobium sp.]|uniref:REP-associated tyrosine transposase n=1 Tax=Bradyrhizobium sp. TaxID=376 RepID=UPI00239C88A4|nr:transposase [Bradyrhizobium sp.]MDE2377818.1 transposase [Bradyrhizobium sp.]